MPSETRKVLSTEVKSVLSKMETAEAIAVLDQMRMNEGDNNNQNQNSAAGAVMAEKSRAELMNTVESIPTEKLNTILKAHGLI